MADVPVFVVMPTFGRPCFGPAMMSVIKQVDHAFVIRTEDFTFTPGDRVSVITDLSRPKNIHRWWNLGITAAAWRAKDLGASVWNVLIMNDDVIACPHLVRTLGQALRHGIADGRIHPALYDASPVLAYPDNFTGDRVAFHRAPGFVDPTTRISGWCFMIRGESGLRADERFVWWYGDNALDCEARRMGGAVMVPGCKVEHLHPNEATAADPELTAQTHRDRETYMQLWGHLPH